jgi:myo-inositol-1(or 4)-monophosphatase
VTAVERAGNARALLAIADDAATAAARLIRERAPDVANLEWRTKQHADFVSEVDTDAEQRIREIVGARAPDAMVLGEELSPDVAAHGITFVVDPLDGTTNFLHGYPIYAVSIGVLVSGELVAGVIHDVARDCRYAATRGGGAWCGDQRLRVSRLADPSRALIGTGFPFKHLQFLEQYQRQFSAIVPATAGVRRAGAAALDLADVAAGRFDAFWELSLAPWDIAAGILLIREAGGVITDLGGNDARVAQGPIVAGNPSMHAWLLDALRHAGAS